MRNLSKTGSGEENFLRGLSRGVSGPRGVGQDVHPGREEIVRASMAQPSCGSLLFHRMYKKTPEGVFYRMFSDVITGDTLAGKAFYAKK